MSVSNPSPFVTFQDLATLGLPTTQSDLMQQWLALIQAAFPDYVPNPGNLEYVQAVIWTLQLAALNDLASTVSDAIFRNFGEKLVGIQPQQGSYAAATVEVTAVDTVGHDIPAGTQFTLADLGFASIADVTIPPGASGAPVTVQAAQVGTAFNNAGAPVETVSQIDWISSVTLVASSSGGQDPEADQSYLARLVAELQLLTPRPITAHDYGTLALGFTPAAGTDQQEVGRATAIDGYDPPSGAPSMVWGTLAARSGTYNNEREVTVFATDANGLPLTEDTYVALQAWFDAFREVNFIVNCGPPTYPTVFVTVSVKAAAGYDPATVQGNVQAAIVKFISPSRWGLPPVQSPAGWQNTVTIYQSVLESVVQNTPGVDHVEGLKFGTTASPMNTADLTLLGACVLPDAQDSTVVVTTL